MSYTADDYFDDVIKPRLASIATFDQLKDVLSEAHHEKADSRGYQKLRCELLFLLMNQDASDNQTIDQVVWDLVTNLYGDRYELRKLEYGSGTSVIKVNYQSNTETI
jgi:hypothetical protein